MFAALAAMWVSCGTPETGQSGRPGDGGASVSGNGGYLFVHMTDQNYGRMFYMAGCSIRFPATVLSGRLSMAAK